MHDPSTVAFEIRYPWRKYGRKGRNDFEKSYRESFITIWHVDPELDGSDDSCGWSRPRFSKDQKSRIESIARDEAREPWYQSFCGRNINSPTEAETLLRQALLLVGRVFSKQHICKPTIKPVTFGEASQWACDLLCSPVDNLRGGLSFLPGYHSNREEDRESDREYTAERFFSCIAGYVLRERRPWYKHPRWHIWHWSVQIHPLQTFKRWAFSRCTDCGGRFTWGYSPWTNSWNSDGPRWFRSEDDVHHSDCKNPTLTNSGQAAPQEHSA
jgi:hypothetical protein